MQNSTAHSCRCRGTLGKLAGHNFQWAKLTAAFPLHCVLPGRMATTCYIFNEVSFVFSEINCTPTSCTTLPPGQVKLCTTNIRYTWNVFSPCTVPVHAARVRLQDVKRSSGWAHITLHIAYRQNTCRIHNVETKVIKPCTHTRLRERLRLTSATCKSTRAHAAMDGAQETAMPGVHVLLQSKAAASTRTCMLTAYQARHVRLRAENL